MKLGFALSVTVALTLAWSSAVLAATHVAVAPLDEYFGKEKLSPLGIDNTIHDTNLRVHYDPAHAARYYSTLAWAENALDDWARKYPHDPWLPQRAYYMSHVFWLMHVPQADVAARRCRLMLFTQFADSRWAVVARQETQSSVAPIHVAKATVPAAKTVPAKKHSVLKL